MKATCHCGNVSVEVETKPESIMSCNCSVCGRLGAMWSYYEQSDVTVTAEKPLVHYRWGDEELDFGHCPTCGCVMYWAGNENSESTRMGINTRMVVPRDVLADIPVQMFDGADSWTIVEGHPGWGGF